MRLYIDPGTGSMLFAILIGIIGALRYLIRSWVVKLRTRTAVDGKDALTAKKIPFVIFSDDRRYWQVFAPVCREMDRRGVDIVYMTCSENDPVFHCGLTHIKPQFIGEGNKAFAKLNFLSANIVLSTTPGLDVYQWKRSPEVDCYVHMLHMPNEITGYRMFGTDYYDALLLSGDYQEADVRELETLRNLPAKEICRTGIPYMDEMVLRLKENASIEKNETRTVLLAPSWGTSAILNRYGEKILQVLLDTGYHIIVRPHPQSFTSEKELMDSLMKKFPESEQLEWNRDADNFEVLRRSDIMISDFSGVIFDFTLVYDKPIIYADTDYVNDPYDSWWLDHPSWTFHILPFIGEKLSKDNLPELKALIDRCCAEEKYASGREQARRETWENPGEGAVRTADYLTKKYSSIINKTGGTE